MTKRGRGEVARQEQRLRAAFEAIDGSEMGPELRSHYSRYLCVLLSGHVEQCLRALLLDFAHKRASAPIVSYVGVQVGQLRNVNKDRLSQLLTAFDRALWLDLEGRCPDELEALDSIAAVRNVIAHGGESGITMATVTQYFGQIKTLLATLSDILDPRATAER